MREHRGEIEVESEPGEGTTFTVRLPATAEALAVDVVVQPGSLGVAS